MPLILTAALLACNLSSCAKRPAVAAGPAVEVAVAPVTQRDVPVTEEWVASLYGLVDAQIRAQVSGLLLRQEYHDGARVNKGDLLFEIDPRPFQAALAQSEGQLAQAEAQASRTKQDQTRYGPLAREQAISQQEYDTAVQADRAAQAQVAAARAAVAQAQLNLDFSRITSPVDGIAGIAQTQIGNLVGPGTGILTTVSTVDPMRVFFPISEQAYLDFTGAGPAGAAPMFPADARLELVLGNGRVYPYPGKFYAADRQIDPTTGTLQIVALFPNPQNLLRPGQFGRVRAVVRTLRGALLVPQRALTELQGGYQVAVVDERNQAHIRMVQVGPPVGAERVVTDGLKPGERVIVEGFQKVKEGTVVVPSPFGAAAAPATPHP